MKVEDLITDEAIKIVFDGVWISNTPREQIEVDLVKLHHRHAIGHTSRCCLQNLGLIYKTSCGDFQLTRVGEKYLEILNS